MHFSYLQAIVTGLIQGIAELFPISSLGHAVLVPAWIGGSWKVFSTSSLYLLVAVALHFASAIALFLVFRKRWFEILGGTVKAFKRRNFRKVEFRVLWLILVATIPVAVAGYLFGDFFQRIFAKPIASALFLTLNGVILFGAERLTRRRHYAPMEENLAIATRVSTGQALVIGVGQSAALFAGISRFGVSMSFGMLRGLSRTVASDFAFLLAFPVILGASLSKLPKLAHGDLSGLWGPVFVGCIVSFIATYFSVKFLVRWFKTNTLIPFAIYCLFFGLLSVVKFGFFN